MRRAVLHVMRRPALPRAPMRFSANGPPVRPRRPITRTQARNSQSPLLPYVFPKEPASALQGDVSVPQTPQRTVANDLVPPSREKTEITHLLHAKRVDAAVEVFRSLPKSADVYCNFVSFLLDKHPESASVAFEVLIVVPPLR